MRLFQKSADFKMAENLSRVNIVLIYTLLFLIVVVVVKSKEEYVPALIWTSREFERRKNVDYLVQKKIKSDLFESYLMELMGGKKPLIVIYIEQTLSIHDLEIKDGNGNNSFSFLNNLMINSEVDYFRSVEFPHQTVVQLYKKGYKWKNFDPDTEFNFNEGDVLLIEFQKIRTRTPETIKNHHQQIERIHRQLVDSGKKWISIYTAKQADNERYLSDLIHLSPWFVEEQFLEKPAKALSLYWDDFTGYTLITKDTIRLYLPSSKKPALKILDNYLGASAKPANGKVNFVIWFLNYTLTLHFNETKNEWLIEGAKLLNGKGDTLKLSPATKVTLKKNKCYFQLTELQSQEKPTIKVTLSKYKFTKLQAREGSCKKSYGFPLTFLLIVFSTMSAILTWSKMLENRNFSTKSKVINIPTESLLLRSKTITEMI